MMLALLSTALLCFARARASAARAELPPHAQSLAFSGKPKWHLASIFDSRKLQIRCESEFKVYTGASAAELGALYSQGAHTWCSSAFAWQALFAAADGPCVVSISPYGATHVAVVPKRSALGQTADCTVDEVTSLSTPLVVAAAAGSLLFLLAPLLAESMAFRISLGGVVSVLVVTLVVSLIMVRRVKHLGTLSGLLTVLGAMGLSAASIFKIWFGFSSLGSMLTSPWFAAYVVLAFFVGASCAYYFDVADAKVVNIIAAAMRLLGAALVAFGLGQLPEAAGVALGALAATLWLPSLLLSTRHTDAAADAAGSPRVEAKIAAKVASSQSAPHTQQLRDGGDRLPAMPAVTDYSASAPLRQLDRVQQPSLGRFSCTPTVPLRETESGCLHTMPGASAASAPPLGPAMDSPLLSEGLVRNTLTGRHIKIGGATYRSLEERGFVLDRASGSMMPPGPEWLAEYKAHRGGGGGRQETPRAGSTPRGASPEEVTPGSTPGRRATRRSTRNSGRQAPHGSVNTSPY